MCGIYVSAQFTSSQNDVDFASVSLELQRVNAARGKICLSKSPFLCLCRSAIAGPDAQNTHLLSFSMPSQTWEDSDATWCSTENGPSLTLDIAFYASELRLRGDFPIVQPHARDGNVLCWNGEVIAFFLQCQAPINLLTSGLRRD